MFIGSEPVYLTQEDIAYASRRAEGRADVGASYNRGMHRNAVQPYLAGNIAEVAVQKLLGHHLCIPVLDRGKVSTEMPDLRIGDIEIDVKKVNKYGTAWIEKTEADGHPDWWYLNVYVDLFNPHEVEVLGANQGVTIWERGKQPTKAAPGRDHTRKLNWLSGEPYEAHPLEVIQWAEQWGVHVPGCQHQETVQLS